MSECVVRMEMPHDGLCNLEQTLIYGLSTYCAINGERCNYSDTGTRPDYCPILCQLPEGHGRLGDLDDLCEGLVSNHPVVIHAKSAPTIVPAERRAE